MNKLEKNEELIDLYELYKNLIQQTEELASDIDYEYSSTAEVLHD